MSKDKKPSSWIAEVGIGTRGIEEKDRYKLTSEDFKKMYVVCRECRTVFYQDKVQGRIDKLPACPGCKHEG